ncbi:MAG TPA: Rne/Rng family ribonuclease [Bacillota bacterium]|jgi:ribonuclease G|nr:Rne/Rng family ribonuclease [Bacillota bacterium]HOA36289.1 Rne/Rng family ribonuclease [Bacillota bacterium]HOJ83159.1 Rne/Rng family ribonuclease [Bacillota bacterium]HOL15522.1 Rne/Rng family ribonuclease [Bacillota bacterium]HPZ11889.1 Rne/Rng family ribonuclease [Bacillota bacterium]
MDKKIIVNCNNRATRVAILENGKLVELYIERPLEHRIVGNLYKGIVANVLPGMQAAFVDIGLEKNAFLYVDDVYTDIHNDETPPPSRSAIEKLLKVGEEIIVQVVKEPFGNKGARVTGQITLPGRYLVLVPGADYIGVSRRIESQTEKERLRREAEKIRPDDIGLIVRTVAEGADEQSLAQDLQFLMQLWHRVLARFQQKTAPAILYQDLALTCRIARDLFVEDFSSFLIDDEHEYEKVLEILDCFSTQLKKKVRFYDRAEPIFERFGVEKELEKALQSQVWLKSGGYLVFDETEALTVIDVNTGRYTGRRNLADTILKTNLEAAEEIARQIRLRDIGGIIIVDFIDMTIEEHRKKVLSRLNESIKHDRTKTYVLGLTSLGLVEMTRKKVRQDLSEVLQQHCPYCNGRGRVFTPLAASTRIERELKKTLQKSPREAILVEMHHEVASIIIGTGGGNLKKMEEELGKHIFIRGAEDMHIEQYRVIAAGSLKEIEKLAFPVSVGDVLELFIEEPHTSAPENGIARIHGYVINVAGAGELVSQVVRAEITEVCRTFARAVPVAAGKKKRRRHFAKSAPSSDDAV